MTGNEKLLPEYVNGNDPGIFVMSQKDLFLRSIGMARMPLSMVWNRGVEDASFDSWRS